MAFKFTSHKKEVLEEMQAAIDRSLERIGMRAERHAKVEFVPVDTGRLKNSISHAVSGSKAIIGTNVEYAPYVELGTSRRSPHAFLRPAVQFYVDEYVKIVKSEMQGK